MYDGSQPSWGSTFFATAIVLAVFGLALVGCPHVNNATEKANQAYGRYYETVRPSDRETQAPVSHSKSIKQ